MTKTSDFRGISTTKYIYYSYQNQIHWLLQKNSFFRGWIIEKYLVVTIIYHNTLNRAILNILISKLRINKQKKA